jgi:hypothetical protein
MQHPEADLRVQIQAREAPDEAPYLLQWDMQKQLYEIILGFGNGMWVEMRVIGASGAALQAFRTILSAGGYHLTPPPKDAATLFQQGDECWAHFIFVDPQPRPW